MVPTFMTAVNGSFLYPFPRFGHEQTYYTNWKYFILYVYFSPFSFYFLFFYVSLPSLFYLFSFRVPCIFLPVPCIFLPFPVFSFRFPVFSFRFPVLSIPLLTFLSVFQLFPFLLLICSLILLFSINFLHPPPPLCSYSFLLLVYHPSFSLSISFPSHIFLNLLV